MQSRVVLSIGGVALWLGLLGLPAVLCLLFPGPLSTPSLREFYPMPLIRGLIDVGLLVAIFLGVATSLAAPSLSRGWAALALSLLALALGGGRAEPLALAFDATLIGLDFLLLDLFALCLLFVPLERLLGKAQPILRRGWGVDLMHFGASHVLISMIAVTTVVPANVLFGWLLDFEYRARVAALPLGVQFVLVILAVDFTNYWVHRAFHAVPWLWRFHAVHHSAREMDWLAGSRQHLGDVLITRAAGFTAVFVLGFADIAIYGYILLISFHAVFIHANVRVEFGRLGWLLTSPRFHHWHHADSPEAIDKNFAVLMPLWDLLFGTALWRREWPASYGLAGETMPEKYMGQLLAPLGKRMLLPRDALLPDHAFHRA